MHLCFPNLVMSSMCPCKVNDKQSPLQGLSEVPSFSTWGAERKPHSRTSLRVLCPHRTFTLLYKMWCWFQMPPPWTREKQQQRKGEGWEEGRGVGQRRRKWRTKRKMKKENTVCVSVIISVKTHTISCFVLEEDFSVQPLTSSGTYCSCWMMCPVDTLASINHTPRSRGPEKAGRHHQPLWSHLSHPSIPISFAPLLQTHVPSWETTFL